mmetsp:Transcript_92803/g.206388  ORF Transcript_92803/g.206388 Transcript_92803/m.206388 type:complete len:124 (-) Transcript_92803:417-788(-)
MVPMGSARVVQKGGNPRLSLPERPSKQHPSLMPTLRSLRQLRLPHKRTQRKQQARDGRGLQAQAGQFLGRFVGGRQVQRPRAPERPSPAPAMINSQEATSSDPHALPSPAPWPPALSPATTNS